MREDRASRTAEYMAVHRAAHQLLDAPTILDDPFAAIVIDPKFARTAGRSRKHAVVACA